MSLGKLFFPLNPAHGALVSQDLRKLFEEGVFGIPYEQDRIEPLVQPASLDTQSAGWCYWLRPGFRHEPGLTVMESVRLSHQVMPQEIPIPKEGLYCQRDFSWLIPLKGDFYLPDGYSLISSAKSTQGRDGNRIRLIADYQPCFDLVKGPWRGRLYIIFEPECWSNIIYEDMAFNQLRFFCGDDNRISDSEIMRRWDSEVFLRSKDEKQVPLMNQYLVREGILMSLDLLGHSSHGIVAFKAIPNPRPIDQKGSHKVEDYFVPIEAPPTGALEVFSDLTILSTLYRHVVPSDLCAEMTPYSSEVGDIKLHEAGFFDPGWDGIGVKEVWSKERHRHTFVHGQNSGRLVYYRNRDIPDKIYGPEIGSSYKFQDGPRLAKQFGKFTSDSFLEFSRLINKAKEDVLVVSRAELFKQHEVRGFEAVSGCDLENRIASYSRFFRRGEAELNSQEKQVIPYMVLMDSSTNEVFCYERSSDIAAYFETKLFGKWAIGVSGHVGVMDGPANFGAVQAGALRELKDQIEMGDSGSLNPGTFKLVGFVNDEEDAVGKVHVGVVFVVPVSKNGFHPKARKIRQWEFVNPSELMAKSKGGSKELEGWTRLTLEALIDGRISF